MQIHAYNVRLNTDNKRTILSSDPHSQREVKRQQPVINTIQRSGLNYYRWCSVGKLFFAIAWAIKSKK